MVYILNVETDKQNEHRWPAASFSYFHMLFDSSLGTYVTNRFTWTYRTNLEYITNNKEHEFL